MAVVVGYVNTPEGEAALDLGIAEAHLRGTKLVLIHSLRGGRHDSEETVLSYRSRLEDIEAQLTADDIAHEIHEYVRGNEPVEDLIAAATDHNAEVIVIGLRKRSQTGKLILGSNATEILFSAPCPVMTVRAE